MDADWTYYLSALLLVACSGLAWLLTLVALPGNWLIVGGAALFAWLLPEQAGQGVTWTTVAVLLGLAVVGELVEFGAGAAGAAKQGASRRAVALSIVGAMVGSILGLGVGTPIPVLGWFVMAVLGGAAALLRARIWAKPGKAARKKNERPPDAARSSAGYGVPSASWPWARSCWRSWPGMRFSSRRVRQIAMHNNRLSRGGSVSRLNAWPCYAWNVPRVVWVTGGPENGASVPHTWRASGRETHLAAEHLLEQLDFALGRPQVDVRIAVRLNDDPHAVVADAGPHVGDVLLMRAIQGQCQPQDGRQRGARAA